MAVGAPDAPAGADVSTTAAARTGAATVAGREQHQNALVKRLDDLAGEGMAGVAGVDRVPHFLVQAPTVGQDVGGAVRAVLVDRPLEAGQRIGDRRAVR